MKKIILFFILFNFSEVMYSQYGRDFQNSYSEIIARMSNKEYYDAIKKMDAFLLKYPETGEMYFNRGLARLNLNDCPAAKIDFIKSM